MPHKSEKVIFDDKDLIILETLSGYRIPMDKIAAHLEISEDTLERVVKRDDAAHAAMMRGRAKASIMACETLFKLATDKKNPNLGALKFWLQVHEGYTIKQQIEHSGEIKTRNITELSKNPKALELARQLAEELSDDGDQGQE